MSEARCAPLARIVSAALRECFHASRSVPLAPLYNEAGIVPYHVYAAAARARAMFKWRRSATWIRALVRNPVLRGGDGARTLTWSEGARAWLRRHKFPVPVVSPVVWSGDDNDAVGDDDPSGHVFREEVLSRGVEVWAERERRRGTKAWLLYQKYDLDSTRRELHFLQRRGWFGSHWAVAAAVSLRVGSFDTVRALVRRGAQPDRFSSECPFCGDESVGEDIPHLLVECAAWRAHREQWLVPVWRAARVEHWVSDEARREEVAFIALGGAVEPNLCGPSAARGVQLPQHPSWLASLAGFMGAVVPLRWKVLRRTAQSQRRLEAGRTGPGGQGGRAGR